MTIAVHINKTDDPEEFAWHAFLQLAELKPDDHFILLFHKAPTALPNNLPANCTPVISGPTIRNNLTRHYWYQYKIPALLSRYQADVFFTSREICCLDTAVPQIMMGNKVRKIATGFAQKYRSRYFQTAKGMVCFRPDVFLKAAKHYGNKVKNILHTGFGIPFLPYSRQGINENNISEYPYFLARVNTRDPEKNILLLKAFSIIKKMQRSSYRLVLLHHEDINNPLPQLNTYRYRQDVVLMQHPGSEMEDTVFREAFAFVNIHPIEESIVDVIRSLHYGKPVCSMLAEAITSEIFGEVIPDNLKNEQMLAGELMRWYKDETIYRQYAQASARFAATYNWQAVTNKLYALCEQAVAQRL